MNLSKQYDVILFDADDTLFDFKRSEKNAFHNAFVKFGLPNGLHDYRQDYLAISAGLWNELEQGKITLNHLAVERFRKLFIKNNLTIHSELFSQAYLDYLSKEPHLVDGALTLCNQLSDYRLAIITNGFTNVQKARVKNSSLQHIFEQVIISEEVGVSKPNKHIFDVAFSKLGITDKNKVLIVGDSLTSDVKGGNNYGIDTCWFNPDKQENISSTSPTYEINRLEELLNILA